MTRLSTRVEGTPEEVAPWLGPRDDIVREERVPGDGPLTFGAVEGPVRHYRRQVTVERGEGDRLVVTSRTELELAVPYFAWLFALPVRLALRGIDTSGRQPWWAPPDRLDPRSASVLGVLAAASAVAGYLSTLLTQTITFAADDLGNAGHRAQGYALAAVRVGVLGAIALVTAADRRGRRPLLLACAAAGCVTAVAGALAPSLPWLAASQLVARSFTTALVVLVAIVAAEEVPRGSRAYAVSVLGMAGGLGAGLCVMALPVADLAGGGWRLLYLVPLAGLLLTPGFARLLPESRRFTAPHRSVPLAGHGGRLLLLAASAFLLALFTAPASQFHNEFLRDEVGFSASRIAFFTVLTVTPGGVGVVLGGRLADVRGRRLVGATSLAGGTLATVLMFSSTGWPLWAWSLVGSVVGAAALPALGVYGPELFPTSLRGRANGVVTLLGVLGSVAGLLATGIWSDGGDALGPVIAVLALGPATLAVLVLVAYPETARRELEDLNPEDRLIPPPGSAPSSPPPPPPRAPLP